MYTRSRMCILLLVLGKSLDTYVTLGVGAYLNIENLSDPRLADYRSEAMERVQLV